MIIYRSKDGLPDRIEFAVLTLGNFDGVHKGHQKLLRLTRKHALKINGTSVVLTFWPHPVKLFKPASFTLIQSLEERLERIEKSGIDVCIVMEFNRDLADHPPQDFVKERMLKLFDLRKVFIGYDTTFGKNRSGTPETMISLGRDLGFETEVVEAVSFHDRPVSSSRIRRTVAAGDMLAARDLLGYPFELAGTIVKGHGRGAGILGFPTANIQTASDLLPPNGVYAVWVYRNNERYRGALNVGNNPTFNNSKVSIEVYILDFDADIYGERLKVKFVERLRDEVKFPSIDDLKAQMTSDVEEVRHILH